MSVFTSRVTKTIEVPREAGQSVTIRKLAPRHLAAAQQASQLHSIDILKKMGGPQFMKEVRSVTPEQIEEATSADPLLLYDRVTLIEKGVVSWTFDADAKDREVIEDLDEDTQQWLATEILKLARPSLYDAVAEKNA